MLTLYRAKVAKKKETITREDIINELIHDTIVNYKSSSDEESSPLRWYGGKYYIADKIVKTFPEHDCYVEPFFGAGHVFFAKRPSKIEVVNDICSELINFWKCLQDASKTNALIEKVITTPYSRQIFEELRDKNYKPKDEVESAFRFFYCTTFSFNGLQEWKSMTISAKKSRGRDYKQKIVKLINAYKRLKNVVIENLDYREIIVKYDDINTLFYLDPPYVDETRTDADSYQYEFTQEQHKELVNLVLVSKGKFAISGYKHKIYEPLEKFGFQRIEFDTWVKCSNSKYGISKSKRTECLWINLS
jgi:DNA adenine methylase